MVYLPPAVILWACSSEGPWERPCWSTRPPADTTGENHLPSLAVIESDCRKFTLVEITQQPCEVTWVRGCMSLFNRWENWDTQVSAWSHPADTWHRQSKPFTSRLCFFPFDVVLSMIYMTSTFFFNSALQSYLSQRVVANDLVLMPSVVSIRRPIEHMHFTY